MEIDSYFNDLNIEYRKFIKELNKGKQWNVLFVINIF